MTMDIVKETKVIVFAKDERREQQRQSIAGCWWKEREKEKLMWLLCIQSDSRETGG